MQQYKMITPILFLTMVYITTIQSMNMARVVTVCQMVTRTKPGYVHRRFIFPCSFKAPTHVCHDVAYQCGAAELRHAIDREKYVLNSLPDLTDSAKWDRFRLAHATNIKQYTEDDDCRINGIYRYIIEHAHKNPYKEQSYIRYMVDLEQRGWKPTIHCCRNELVHYAVKYDLFHITQFLLKYNALVNTSVIYHVQSEHVAALLLEKLPNAISEKDFWGNTLLHKAPAHVIPYLLDVAESKTTQVNEAGHTPLQQAIHDGVIGKIAAFLTHEKAICSEFERDKLINIAKNRHKKEHETKCNAIVDQLRNFIITAFPTPIPGWLP